MSDHGLCESQEELKTESFIHPSLLYCKMALPRTNIDASYEGNARKPVFEPALSNFFVQLPHKIEDAFKSGLKKFRNDKERFGYGSSSEGKVFSREYEPNLEKQLQAWKQNPSWVDQPAEIKVTVPKGSLCNITVRADIGLPPDAIYNIVTDPDNKRVFKNIKEVISREVLVDEGLRQVVEVEQATIWKFLWWSGTFAVKVMVDQNRADHSMKFKLAKTGFMEKFEGSWRVEPLFIDKQEKGRVGSRVSLEQLIQPAVVPPPPLSWYVRGITARTTEMLMSDLITEASRIRGDTGAAKSDIEVQEKHDFDGTERTNDVKERWAMRRKASKMRNKSNT